MITILALGIHQASRALLLRSPGRSEPPIAWEVAALATTAFERTYLFHTFSADT